MRAWPQQEKFRDLVRAYRKEHELSPEGFASLIDMAPGSLHSMLYDKGHKPGLPVVQRAAGVLGISITELVDDKNAPILGQDVSNLSEHDRVLAHMMFHDFTTADDLTTEDRKALVDAYNLNRAALRALKARKP